MFSYEKNCPDCKDPNPLEAIFSVIDMGTSSTGVCSECFGSGDIGPQFFSNDTQCKNCGGTGECPTCDGSGRI